MAKFLHVGCNFEGSASIRTAAGKQIETALDWYRYAPNCWVLWTNRTPEDWYKIIQPHIGDKATFFVCEINTENQQGWMTKDFWDWLQKDRTS